MKSFPLTHPAFLILGLLGLLAAPLAHAEDHLSMVAEVDREAQTVSVTVTDPLDGTAELEATLVMDLDGISCSVSVTKTTAIEDTVTYENLLEEETEDCSRANLDLLMTAVAGVAGNDVAAILRLTAAHIILGARRSTTTTTSREPTGSGLTAPDGLTMDAQRHQNIVDTLSDKATLTKPSLEPQKFEYKGDATDIVLGVETKFSVDQDPGVPQQQRITK